jgi:uncharacterized RDD family membrane protein YckC
VEITELSSTNSAPNPATPSADKLIIETPEQTALEFTLAGIGSRGLALMLDTVVQGAVILALGLIALVFLYATSFPRLGKLWGYAILIFVAFFMELGYFAFFESIWNGQTPGKRWTHLRVIKDSGRPIGTQDAVLRNLLRIVDSFPTLYATGIITCLISPQNKRIGDYLAGTVVVREKSIQAGRELWDNPAPQTTAAIPSRILSPAELQLIEAFLERRSSFTDDVRRGMARQIAERINQGAPMPQEALHDPEKFLQEFAERNRNSAYFR